MESPVDTVDRLVKVACPTAVKSSMVAWHLVTQQGSGFGPLPRNCTVMIQTRDCSSELRWLTEWSREKCVRVCVWSPAGGWRWKESQKWYGTRHPASQLKPPPRATVDAVGTLLCGFFSSMSVVANQQPYRPSPCTPPGQPYGADGARSTFSPQRPDAQCRRYAKVPGA